MQNNKNILIKFLIHYVLGVCLGIVFFWLVGWATVHYCFNIPSNTSPWRVAKSWVGIINFILALVFIVPIWIAYVQQTIAVFCDMISFRTIERTIIVSSYDENKYLHRKGTYVILTKVKDNGILEKLSKLESRYSDNYFLSILLGAPLFFWSCFSFGGYRIDSALMQVSLENIKKSVWSKAPKFGWLQQFMGILYCL